MAQGVYTQTDRILIKFAPPCLTTCARYKFLYIIIYYECNLYKR